MITLNWFKKNRKFLGISMGRCRFPEPKSQTEVRSDFRIPEDTWENTGKTQRRRFFKGKSRRFMSSSFCVFFWVEIQNLEWFVCNVTEDMVED